MVKVASSNAILCICIALRDLPHVLSFTSPVQRSFAGLDTTRDGFGGKLSFTGASLTAASRYEESSWMTQLQMSSSEEESTSSTPRRRRRRKDGKNAAPVKKGESENEPVVAEPGAVVEPVVEPSPAPAPVPVPPKSKTAEVTAVDIRDIVSGKAPPSTADSPSTKATEVEDDDDEEYYDDDDDDELEDDEEYEYYYTDENDKEVIVGTSSNQDNSLESLLADARRMRESESDSAASSDGEEEGSSIKSKVKSVLSTIVTADFFVVCALLAWFLAGIFCSYVIKDDTVQIAFNGIFEPVVQPALGILMIGSAAGAAFSDEDKDE